MASKVKVVDGSFRQVEIKVNPGTHLTDVLEQACARFKVDPTRYLLKHKQRQLDLSHTWRTSGLVQGAKLELVVKSNTPAAIDVALQLPPPESDSFPPHGRLTEKLPSDVTVWKLLRHFESGRPSEGKTLNITGRGVPRAGNGDGRGAGGSGQLYYETPVLQVGNRQLSTFADFQKTLSQLGYNSGRVLIRLSFQQTDKTFVDAITDVDRYFQGEKQQQKQEQDIQQSTGTEPEATPPSDPTASGTTDDQNAPQTTTSVAEATTPAPSQPDLTVPDTTTTATSAAQGPAGDAMDIDDDGAGGGEAAATKEAAVAPPEASDAVRIFAAPTSATPQAVRRAGAGGQGDDEDDDAFVPGIEHARAHQRLLKAAGQNRRLPSDREIADREAAERRRLAETASVRIRVRLPDNSLLERDFGQADTGAALYAAVRGVMADPAAGPFRLTLPPLLGGGGGLGHGHGHGTGGNTTTNTTANTTANTNTNTIIDSADRGEEDALIRGYRLRGQVIVTFVWDDAAPAHVRRRVPFLRRDAAARAREVVVPEVPDVIIPADDDRRDGDGKTAGGDGDGGGVGGGRKQQRHSVALDALRGKTPKWLKGLGGKK